MMRSKPIAKRYQTISRVMFPLCLLLLVTSCISSDHASYLESIDKYNKTIATHEVARVDLNPDGTVSSIVFSGLPTFIAPIPEENPILTGMKILLPIASRLIDPGGVTVPILKAGNDIIYNADSNNTADTDTIVLTDSPTTDTTTATTTTDSHDIIDNHTDDHSIEVTP